MPPHVLEKVVGYLNSLNEDYADGETEYNWSGLSDNCSHTLHNALAAAGVWDHKSINSFKLKQIFNLSIPANEFMDLAILTSTFPVDDPGKIYSNKAMLVWIENLQEIKPFRLKDGLVTSNGWIMVDDINLFRD